ncbi:MAG: endolytic transglycosylase MltG [Spirochaetaceae bacterium]|jgi:UPF0755 protein|nr:endolytic transglycosylase MltG [Spirochaetaceae bacterium]
MNYIVRTICKVCAWILGSLFVLAGSAAALIFYMNAAPQDGAKTTSTVTSLDTGEVRLEVREGESASSVGMRLEEANLIKQYYAWQLLCHLRPAYLQAGMYQFKEKCSLIELHTLFTSGQQILLSITIPEGSTLKKTAMLLEKDDICTAEDFLAAARNDKLLHEYHIYGNSFEGFLYPDTYYFTVHYPANLVVRTMADTFYRRLKTLDIDVTAYSAEDFYAKVTLASIIEREYRIEDEAPLMAGVFLRRLKTGMRLESCATVVYVMTELLNQPHPKKIFHRDLELESPYNTYMHRGLPPSPIAAPGAIALQAAFFPTETDYLFFRIIDPSAGRHYFSKTFDDHIKAGALFIK